MNLFTPTERRILALLGDGEPHGKKEIMDRCFDDDLVNEDALRNAIHRLKKKLKEHRNEEIVAVRRYRATYYQHFRKISAAD